MKSLQKVIDFIDNNLNDTAYYLHEDMKKHTTFKTGGPADLLVEPQSISEMQKLMRYVFKKEIPYLVIGQGSNLIVSDKGIRELVVKIGTNLSQCAVNNETIEAEAGATIINVSKEAQKHSLTGLEFACGIPGSVGGAVFMNAGAYDGEIKNILEEVLVLTVNGDLLIRKAKELELGYRTSVMQRNGEIILKAKFKLQKGNKDDISQKMKELTQRREKSQPLEFPSAGSIFKRPEGYYTGKLIEDANLKGYKIGGAQVSPKHAGFIINTGNATSSDILNLIKHIQTEVRNRFGVELETEVRTVGEF
ncbi:MAG: UDP-N-acetylmuramate dehydrogenase [Firmicutes bacterium]|jgi:UDP-N-acetylmuramate dehydrogenase|nr:UDP-N-acetylmuramate dehydrogenase [Bacillota bacterium]